MAEARKVPAVTQVVTPEKVHLILESREAAFLTVLLSKVGGSPTLSARAHSDSIAKALQGLGFRWDRLEEDPGFQVEEQGGHAIIFTDDPRLTD